VLRPFHLPPLPQSVAVLLAFEEPRSAIAAKPGQNGKTNQRSGVLAIRGVEAFRGLAHPVPKGIYRGTAATHDSTHVAIDELRR